MTTIAINSQIAGMSPAQFAAVPPYVKLQHSAKMPNQFLMDHAVLSRKQVQRVGPASGIAAQVFQPVHMRVMQPIMAAKRPLNSWMASWATFADR